jgi:hypothetical protein
MAVLTMRRAALLAGALGACLWAWSCFSPRQPACAFSCVADGQCPAGYTCSATDGWCHRDDGPDAACDPSLVDAGTGTGGAGGAGAAGGAGGAGGADAASGG